VRSILTVVAVAAVMGGVALAQAQSGDVYQIGNGVTSPVLVKEVKPSYTEGAMRRRVEGVVELSAVVLADGTVGDDVRITRTLDDELDQQAIKAVKQWTFRPGTKGGYPVAVQVNIELSFTLKK
jgi:periplasmic protein TonB